MRPVLTTFLVALLLAAPLAVADHWMLRTSGIDDSVNRTLEDDGQVMDARGNVLDDRTNRVTYPGREPGDGTLFLDAIAGSVIGLGNSVTGLARVGPDIFTRELTSEFLGRSDILLPGNIEVSAWYGWWQDSNSDGVIDDLHDANCGTSCAQDEFLWRGLASSETPAVIMYRAPYDWPPTPSPTQNGAIVFGRPLADGTARANEEQGWSGSFFTNVDGGLIARVQTLVLAGARDLLASPLGYDIDDPAALYDVDSYNALSGDVEALYVSTLHADIQSVLNAVVTPINTVFGAVVPLTWPVQEIVNDHTENVSSDTQAAIQDAIPDDPGDAEATQAFVSRTQGETIARNTAWHAREPNTEWDDYEGRALWGGTTDVYGPWNEYSGYANSHHLFADAVAREVPTTPPYVERSVSPSARMTSGPLVTFAAYTNLWHDINGDGYVGAVCDPSNSDEYDASRGTCDPSLLRSSRQHSYNGEESVAICETASAKGGELVLTSLGGDWDGTLIVRDYDERSTAPRPSVEVPTNGAPIYLNWRSECSASGEGIMVTRDGIIFPASFTAYAIRVEFETSITGFGNQDLGINVGPESVRDVDILLPFM